MSKIKNKAIKSKFATVDGVNIHYLESGKPGPNKELILLLHAWPAGALMWDKHMPVLGEKYHVLAPDFPGFSYSDMMLKPHISDNYVDFVLDFLKTMGYRKAHIVGYSYGSIVAAKLAIKSPKVIRSLCLGALPYYHKHFLPKGAKKLFDIIDEYEKIQRLIHSITRSKFIKYVNGMREKHLKYLSRAEVSNYFEYFINYKDHALRDATEELMTLDIRELLPKIKMPCLLVVGDRDNRISVDQAYKLNKLIPKSELKVFEGNSHILPIENAEEFAEEILAYVEDHSN
jgi:pimeloyl-ACP methyl ester carboxylesterase